MGYDPRFGKNVMISALLLATLLGVLLSCGPTDARLAPLVGFARAYAETVSPAVTGEPAVANEEDESVEISDTELRKDEAELAAIEGDQDLNAQEKLNEVFKRYQTLGACVCVLENGKITHTYCYGSIDREGAPVTEDAMFRVGSISKMITAMGVMRLVEDGKATLDGDLSEMLGVTVRNAQYPDTPVTLRQLMSHTAGFRDSGYYTLALRGQVAPLTQLFSANVNPFVFLKNFEAGTDTRYSNFGGGLLGCLIENLTGQTVDQYMADTVFSPLGLTAAYQSALLPKDATVSDMYVMPSRALGALVRDGSKAAVTPDPLSDYTLTAGKLTLSAPGLARLLTVLCDGGVYGDTRILQESSVAAMCTLQNYIGSVVCESGRGLCMNILQDVVVEGRTMYGHGGKANGMLCAAYFDPSDRTGVVMLTNGCNNRPMYHDVGMLSRAVLRVCYSEILDGRHVTENPWLVSD